MVIKDYAHRKQQPAAKRPVRWPALTLLAAAALGLLTVLAVQIHHFSKQKAKAAPTRLSVKKAAPTQQPSKPKTHFEFYTLLSKQPVPQTMPHQDDASLKQAPTSTTANTDKTNNSNQAFYQLQAASLQNRIDAQTFARQLLSIGYQSSIQPYLHRDGTTWYRVVIGPVDNFASAKQIQTTLSQHHIDSLLTRTQ